LNQRREKGEVPGERTMKVLVTGGTGFIGSAVASTLAKKGHEVIIYSHTEIEDAALANIEYVKGDIFDTSCLSKVLKECDGVIHMVGLAGVRIAYEHPEVSFDLNIRSLQILLEEMRNNGVSRLVLPSSSAVYGIVDKLPISEDTMPKPTNIYGFHKYIVEKLAEAYSLNYGIRVTILRPFNVYGRRESGILEMLFEKTLRNEVARLYGQKQKRDFIHVSEVADAVAAVLQLDHGFEIYNVGAGVGRSIENIVNLFRKYFPTLSIEYTDSKDVLYDSVADITKIRNATGFNPDVTDDRLKQVIEELRNEYTVTNRKLRR